MTQFRKQADILAELLAEINGMTDEQLTERLATLSPSLQRKLGSSPSETRKILRRPVR